MQTPAPAPLVKLGIRERGMVQVGSQALAAVLGVPEGQIRNDISTGNLSLTSGDQQVSWAPASDGAAIVFYGQGIESIYTVENIYWLKRAPGKRMRIAAAEVAHPSQPFQRTFPDTVHSEKNLLPRPAVATSPEQEYWFWDYLSANSSTGRKRQFTVSAPQADGSGLARLVVKVQGGPRSSSGDLHRVLIRMNGQTVGDIQWSSAVARSLETVFEGALLRPGDNTVELEAPPDGSEGLSYFFVDAFDLTYSRKFRATGDSLEFTEAPGAPIFGDGFSAAPVRLFDLSNPLDPVELVGPALSGSGGDFQLDSSGLSVARKFAAATEAGLKAPAWIHGAAGPSLKQVSGAEYLVITTTELLPAANALAQRRAAKGLKVLVTDVEDVINEFNHGVFSPVAIQDFIRHAYQNWNPKPRWVLLAGGGTYDYKDALQLGGPGVPPLMVPTSWGLFASDNAYADVLGSDGVPEVSIGRIAVRTLDELTAYVAKVAKFEDQPPLSGQDRALLVADDQLSFDLDLRRLAKALPAPYSGEEISLSQLAPGLARKQLLGALSTGVGFLGYVGHGGVDRLSAAKLLSTDDLATLGAGPLIFGAWSCAVNSFELPSYTSLGESMVAAGSTQTLASFAPTGVAIAGPANALGLEFEAALGRRGRIGDAVQSTVSRYLAAGGPREVSDIYVLLGDPALEFSNLVPAKAQGKSAEVAVQSAGRSAGCNASAEWTGTLGLLGLLGLLRGCRKIAP